MRWIFKVPVIGTLLCLLLHDSSHMASGPHSDSWFWCNVCRRDRL